MGGKGLMGRALLGKPAVAPGGILTNSATVVGGFDRKGMSGRALLDEPAVAPDVTFFL